MSSAEDGTLKLRKAGGDVLGCERCDSEARTIILETWAVRRQNAEVDGRRPTRLCRFCSETELGTVLQYPDQHPDQQTLVRGLCQALNLLMP